jgi:hypothetical protein
VVGRASNRKKAQRHAGQKPQANAATQQASLTLAAGPPSLPEENEERDEGVVEASRAWHGGAEPVPAPVPRWPGGSLGHRFFAGTHLSRTRTAPCLATAEIPAATVIHADSAHWSAAIQALIRAVAFDGLELHHPAVRRLLEILLPVAEAELAYNEIFDVVVSRPGLNWDEDLPYFPELDGPLFLLGACVLVEAFGAVVGDDLFGDVLGVLLPALEDAIPGLDGQVAADALIGAFAVHHDCDQPGNAEVKERTTSCGDVLGDLAAAGAVPTELVLPVGLTMLSVLADFCRSDSASILQRTAHQA